MSRKYDICDNFHIHVPNGVIGTKKMITSNRSINVYPDKTVTIYNNTGTRVSTSSTKKHSSNGSSSSTKKHRR